MNDKVPDFENRGRFRSLEQLVSREIASLPIRRGDVNVVRERGMERVGFQAEVVY